MKRIAKLKGSKAKRSLIFIQSSCTYRGRNCQGPEAPMILALALRFAELGARRARDFLENFKLYIEYGPHKFCSGPMKLQPWGP